MKKYIHYCWFGGKPLPKLAKKCIKSWKKYLPDYEIMEWNENNVDLNECPFVKEAYENKKWAFVADYFRAKALKEYGGIYFDTDMKIIKPINFLLENDTFLGIEDSGKIAAGVWFEKNAEAYLPTKLYEFYKSCNGFSPELAHAISIPKIITNSIDDSSYTIGKKEIQHLKHNITIFPRDYFYPYSYDRQNNEFTDNTCMIHYYDATWVPKYEQREIKIFRILGRDKGQKFINLLRKTKSLIRKTGKVLLFPIVLIKRRKREKQLFIESLTDFKNNLKKINKNDYLVIYRKDWLGTSYATKELFDNCIGIKEIDENLCNSYANLIIEKHLKLIIFSAFDLSWTKLVKKIKELNPKQKIKVLWHGSNAMNIDEYDWNALSTILEFNKYSLIDSIGFVKKSMYDFYKTKGIKCEFVMNTVNLSKLSSNKKEVKNTKIKIGIYASGDRWLKNFYNQLSAASMIENHIIDCIPRTEKTIDFANLINANLIGEHKPIEREQLLLRLSENDINLYVTFVECAPMLPLESLEMGVPCITSNNHHYWEGTELEKYLIVNAPDNIIEIKKQIDLVLKNKETILKIYKEWKRKYDKQVKESIESFLNK